MNLWKILRFLHIIRKIRCFDPILSVYFLKSVNIIDSLVKIYKGDNNDRSQQV